eukprot:scaffold843_cov330-Pavlova_lutheri.AAC.32
MEDTGPWILHARLSYFLPARRLRVQCAQAHAERASLDGLRWCVCCKEESDRKEVPRRHA